MKVLNTKEVSMVSGGFGPLDAAVAAAGIALTLYLDYLSRERQREADIAAAAARADDERRASEEQQRQQFAERAQREADRINDELKK
jgi:lactobin A/cerein 7B family class IIb bacteriocin